MPFLADTNILLRLAEPNDPDYVIVRGAVDTLFSRGEERCFTAQNLVEFWNVCTRPVDKNGFGLSTAEADERAKIIEAEFRFLPDGEHVHAEWRRLVVRYAVAGTKVYDARLVAAMLVHDVSSVLTLNDRDFARYSEIAVVHPRTVGQAG